ncbi:MAG: glutamate-5-semialdehyde dehydrogenase [candidate division NC10 bacterium]|nr:glutamate-5-semialdehyde dehydrogenase [candidate division NC10 bacterium]MBI2113926.1 glutamate-5-semialdehyde dehydrogenase [candidate division NC10 bacterium]
MASAARAASQVLARATGETKNAALRAMAAGLLDSRERILAANAEDVAVARAEAHPGAFVDRLTLTPPRLDAMARGLRQIADLPDPVGEITGMWRRPNDLQVGRMRVPLGVIGIIYESRPNVTADAAGLCLKSGNAVILRGGREALRTNAAIGGILAAAVASAGLPEASLAVVPTPDRAVVKEMLLLSGLIDLIIPRGGEELIRMVREGSHIPVIAHDKGLCHTYVDAGADLGMAADIAYNAKVERPGVCNAMETLLVHAAVAEVFLPGLVARLRQAGVEVRGCPKTRALAPGVQPATEADWDTEYLDLVLSIRVVDSFEEAVAHIARHGSGLAEAIVTADHGRAMRFLREVDAGAVFVNASTRFTDGYEFGMGAEMGISTQKLHARGPMGLAELTCQKFIVLGAGQIRDSRG